MMYGTNGRVFVIAAGRMRMRLANALAISSSLTTGALCITKSFDTKESSDMFLDSDSGSSRILVFVDIVDSFFFFVDVL